MKKKFLISSVHHQENKNGFKPKAGGELSCNGISFDHAIMLARAFKNLYKQLYVLCIIHG
jgi:hypothetical protein